MSRTDESGRDGLDTNRLRNWAHAYQRLMAGGMGERAHTACVDDFTSDEGDYPYITAADVLALLAEHRPTPAEEPAEVAVEERDSLHLAISDPGATTPRRMNENVTAWTARAVLASDWLRDHDAALTAKAKAEGRVEALREAADAVQAVYDMQCPPRASHFADDNFGRGAVCAHRWWSTVLGGTLRNLRERADREESA